MTTAPKRVTKVGTVQYRYSSGNERTAVRKVQDRIGVELVEGIATEILIQDDRGGQGTINVFITKPKR
jgi:hypothetical protein